MPTRRSLAFADLGAVLADLDRLAAGHATVGRWSLAQICDHLTRAIRGTLIRPPAGPTPDPTPEQDALRAAFFRDPTIPTEIPLPSEALAPHPAADLATATAALRDAIDRLRAHPGPLRPHPILGPLTVDEWRAFHANHAAHHLGFAVPA